MSSEAPKIVKLSQREHVLARPGMYMGSMAEETLSTYAPLGDCLPPNDKQAFQKSELTYVPALLKIFGEVVSNALDQAIRLATRPGCADPVRNIKVDLCEVGARGALSVMQDGLGLDSSLQSEHGVHGPELLFGCLLSGTNFNDVVDGTERVCGGLNGVGATLVNIMSKEFVVDTVDSVGRKHYVQRFADNMTVVDKPSIKACSKKPYVRITFTPDWERFGYPDGMTHDTYALFSKCVYDLCAVTGPEISVHLNGVKLPYKDLDAYADLYLGSKREGRPRVYAKLHDRWEIIVSHSEAPGEPQCISFVNGIPTFRGGRHVDAISSLVSKKIVDHANKRKGGKPSVRPAFVASNLFLIIKCTISDPSFDSQTKECLSTPAARFGVRLDVADGIIDKVVRTTAILERCDALAAAATDKLVAKTDGNAKKVRVSVAKLDDANFAGTARSAECTLFIVEGDSAKAFAIAGLTIVGRDRFGVYPIRGKLMNVRDATAAKIAANAEIADLKKIIGLETGKRYASAAELRYGRICCLTDADHDGAHITALIMNAFATLWPTLYYMDGFLALFMTPILKAVKGKDVKTFFSQQDYKEWVAHVEPKGYAIHYLKGLGSSTSSEAREYFKEFRTKRFMYNERSDDKMSLAFCGKRADDRKRWLEQYDPERILDVPPVQVGGALTGAPVGAPVTHEEFVDLELIHFSNASVERAIPSAIDGLKPSQRKILFGCFKEGLTKGQLKVAQLSGIVSSRCLYHHGEASLQQAITCMAQDFVGSNNCNLLMPIGQFGSRLMGGSDAASPRYIHTRLSTSAPLIFRPEDTAILKYVVDEGVQVEPRFYVPIIPFVLLNGALGIGTGFSTSLPSYEPLQVLANVRRLIAGEPVEPMKPWYRGFTGSIDTIDGKMWSFGKFAKKGATVIEVTELPVGTWTDTVKEHYDAMIGTAGLRSVDNQCSDTAVRFSLKFGSGADVDALVDGVDEKTGLAKIYGVLKLASQKCLATSNVHLYGQKFAIRKYVDTEAILREHFDVRLDAYARRKAHLDAELEALLVVLNAKSRFVREVIAGDIKLLGIKGADLEAILRERDYPLVEECYGYLTRMPVSCLTAERASALEEDALTKQLDLQELRAMTERAMWTKELDELEAHFMA